MKVIDLPQRGNDWLNWRRQGISASDAPILVSRSPYKSMWRLWAEKTGFATEVDLHMNPLVRKGKENEDKARRLWEQRNNEFALPICVQSSKHKRVRASLDGLTLSGRPLEIKCPSEVTWKDVLANREQSEAYKVYWCQVQQQLYVTEATIGYLVFYFEGQMEEFVIVRDDQFIFELLAEAEKFWHAVTYNMEPPQDPLKDKYLPRGNDASTWIFAATKYRDVQSEIDKCRAELERLKKLQQPHVETMKGLLGEYRSGEYAGVLVTQYTVQGALRCRVTMTDQLEPRNIVDEAVLKPIRVARSKVAIGSF